MKKFKSAEEKEAFVQATFDRIADHYDLMNKLITFGFDRGWRRKAVHAMDLRAGSRVLDVACGTGALELEMLKWHSTLRIDALDFNREMLRVAGENLTEIGKDQQVELVEADAMSLPYEKDTFDGAISAFALRNVPDIQQVLNEMARVTKPGSWVVTLELAKPTAFGFKQVYHYYFNHIMPYLATKQVGNRSYQWLAESIRYFPNQDEIANMFRKAGLEEVSYEGLTGSVVAVHRGRVPQ